MSRYFEATDEFAIESIEEMDPVHPGGAGRKRGMRRACVHIWEPPETPHPSLPTLRELLAQRLDAGSGILTVEVAGESLRMDAAPLQALPPEYLDLRVSPGCVFVTHEARERAAQQSRA
jgi:hypothetical protein